MVAIMMAAPLLGVMLVVGIAISIFQAVTQINEMTLTFVPKVLAVFVVLVVFGPWMLSTMIGFTTRLFDYLPELVR
jgi:flagellar biosynthetic protein FliQ